MHWWHAQPGGKAPGSSADADADTPRPADAHAADDAVLAGKDLVGGGSWLVVRPSLGRWAALTNFWEALPPPGAPAPPSRGKLALAFAYAEPAEMSPLAFLQQLQREAPAYSGFNLLCGETRRGEAAVLGNRDAAAQAGAHGVPAGVHGLSNGVFNEEWPKVSRGRRTLTDVLHAWPAGAPPPVEALLSELLGDAECGVPDEQLPRRAGVTRQEARQLASAFVEMEELYGSGRCVHEGACLHASFASHACCSQ